MTRDRINEGLEILVMRLADNHDTASPPPGFEPHEWAFIKGLAGGAINRMRAGLLLFPPNLTEGR